MNRTSKLSPLLLILFFVGCSDLGEAPKDDFVNYTGTISDQGGGFYVIQSDLPIGQTNTVCPNNLPLRFQRNGLKVRFSGRFEDISPTGYYAYLPVRLSSIQTIDDDWVIVMPK